MGYVICFEKRHFQQLYNEIFLQKTRGKHGISLFLHKSENIESKANDSTIIKMTQMYIICQLTTLTLLFQQLLKVAMFYYKQPSQKLPTKEGVILRKLEFDLLQIVRSYSYKHVRKKLNLKTIRKEKLFYRKTCR